MDEKAEVIEAMECGEFFASDFRDRWVGSHTLLPFALVYVLGISPPIAMLMVYGFETLEITAASCIVGNTIENTVDIVLMDPLAGALGIGMAVCVIWLGKSPRRTQNDVFDSWCHALQAVGTFLLVMSPTTVLWLVEDDSQAQIGFGFACFVIFTGVKSWKQPAERQRRIVRVVGVYVGSLMMALTVVPWNTHLLNIVVHVAAVMIVLLVWRASKNQRRPFRPQKTSLQANSSIKKKSQVWV